jgi:hypothetical protein
VYVCMCVCMYVCIRKNITLIHLKVFELHGNLL